MLLPVIGLESLPYFELLPLTVGLRGPYKLDTRSHCEDGRCQYSLKPPVRRETGILEGGGGHGELTVCSLQVGTLSTFLVNEKCVSMPPHPLDPCLIYQSVMWKVLL